MFELKARDGLGKIGVFHTKHGDVNTPALMPVINPNQMLISPSEMKQYFNCEILITNSYIIYKNEHLRSKAETMGVHGLLDYNGVIMTDSGIISFTPTNEDVGIYLINISVRDENGSLAYQIITFSVVNVNDPPSIEPIEELTVEAGKQFNLQMIAYDMDQEDTIAFSDNTELFDIDPNTGEISFTPSEKDAGVHQVIITVTDGNGGYNETTINITIIGLEDEVPYYLWILTIVIVVLIIFLIFLYIKATKYKGLPDESLKEDNDDNPIRNRDIMKK